MLAAAVVAGSFHAARDHIFEEWNLWRLRSGSAEEKAAAGSWLASRGSARAIPRLLDRGRAAPLVAG